ncbi:MAG: hypothetical protein M1833_005790 [Piccolia ochrophora]|nr:MAG: hypothetical protein M1833_005790 [Piccolia ochrophora]
MTEPEDLEEDLFADLYDGDENAAKPLQPQTVVEPTPSVPSVPPGAGAGVSSSRSDGVDSSWQAPVKEESQLRDQPAANAQNGEVAGGWPDKNANDYGDTAMEEETHGPGIKEDG